MVFIILLVGFSMPNVTIPDSRANVQGWVMTDKRAHQALWRLGKKSPSAVLIVHFLSSRMNRGTNAVVISLDAISKLMGLSKKTVQNSVKALETGKFIQILKTGKSNVYVLNHQVAWQGSRGARFASFGAELVISEQEQKYTVEEIMVMGSELIPIPVLQPNEQLLVGNEQIDPPDQQEMELP
jgi:hypothetical protein